MFMISSDDTNTPSTDTPSPNPNIPRYFSQLKKAHKQRQVPELREDDLEESFVRGSSPQCPTTIIHHTDVDFG